MASSTDSPGITPSGQPRLRGGDRWREIAASMLRWADGKHLADPVATAPLSIAELVTDTLFADFITASGFARNDAPMMRFHRRSLAREIPEPDLPSGYTIRSIVSEDEYEERVESHREVWSPSKFTVDGYRQLRSSPGYDPELDLVVVAPDGDFAANTICWHDEVNRSGEFEPVGTRAAYRGMGLAKALLHEGMRRLRACGCEMAYVNTTEDREAACRLYLSAGFEIVNRWVYYQRTDSLPG
jgi:mycothiol synthase